MPPHALRLLRIQNKKAIFICIVQKKVVPLHRVFRNE